MIRSVFESVFSSCRSLAAVCATFVFGSRVRQWRKVAYAGRPTWDERNQIIAAHIPAGSSVLDVGCGAQTLRQYLHPSCRYQPSDLIKSAPEVIPCDLNAGKYPEVSERFDYVVCSGVLEYINEPKIFLRKIPTLGRTVIMSYNPLSKGGSKLARLGNGWGWVNHFTKDELEKLFEEMGLQWAVIYDEKYVIYTLNLKQEQKG